MNTAIFEMRTRFLILTVFGLVSTLACQVTTADEFKLKDGRTLVGQLKSGPKADAPQWTVELQSGALIRFPSSQLETNGHLKTGDRIKKYNEELQKVLSTPESAESHAAMAGWCNKNGLKEQEQAHYRRVLDFNPDHPTARSALQYIKDSAGRWVARDEFMTEGKGKVKVGGKYIYPEVYAFNEEKETRKDNIGKARVLIDNLQRNIIANNANAEKALAELTQINNPYAVPVFGEKLSSAKTPTNLKLIYIQMLSQVQSLDAVGPLVQATLYDDEPQIRNLCLESLSRFGRDYAIASYITVLRAISTSKPQEGTASTITLKRAAVGLNYLKAENAVLPLIEALVTLYKMTRKQQDQINSSGGTTFGGKPETTIEKAQNQEVLAALVSLTRQNFNYDKQAWLNWYASVYAAPMGDLRRDP